MDTMLAPHKLFNEASFSVLIPNVNDAEVSRHDIESIVTCTPRRFALFDEQLCVYLYCRIPRKGLEENDDAESTIESFFHQLEVYLECTLVDGQSSSHSSSSVSTRSNLKQVSSQPQMRTSTSNSPKIHKRDLSRPPDVTVPFHSHTYNSRGKDPEPITGIYDDAFCCLYTLKVPIVYVKTRATSPMISFNFNISYRPIRSPPQSDTPPEEEIVVVDSDYDLDLLETVDLLEGLAKPDQPQTRQRYLPEAPARSASSSGGLPSAPSTSQLLPMRRVIRESLAARTGLQVKMRTTNLSLADKTVILSVELENPPLTDCIFEVDKMDVQVSNAIVSEVPQTHTLFPLTMNGLDEMVFLYKVTVLEDGSIVPPKQPQRMFPSRRAATPAPPMMVHNERLQPQRVSIQVFGTPTVDGIRGSPMRSKWNTVLEFSHGQREDPATDPHLGMLYGRTSLLGRSHVSLSTSDSNSPGTRSVGSPMTSAAEPRKRLTLGGAVLGLPRDQSAAQPAEVEITDGIIVSFTVPDKITVGEIFALHMFIVNRSKHTRRFQVMIPNRKRQTTDILSVQKSSLPPLPAEQHPIEPFMDEVEFLRQYFANETHDADIICLENNVRLSALGPSTSQAVDIRFIAVKRKLHTIDLLQLVDQDTGFVTNLGHVLEIFVE